MRRFFFAVTVIWLFLGGPASAAATADLKVVQPIGPLNPGSACAGPHPAIPVTVKNRGTVANVAVGSPDGASISGGPISGYAALPAIAPGGTATVQFTVISTRASMSPPKKAERLITMTVVLDPKHRAGLAANSTDVPALLTSDTCTGPEETASPSPSPSPSPTPSAAPTANPKPTPSTSSLIVIPIVQPIGTTTATPTPAPASLGRSIARGFGPPITTLRTTPTPAPTPTPAFVPPVAALFHGAAANDLTHEPPGVPQNLRQPTGMQDCTAHAGFGGGLVCAAVYGQNGSGLALIWDTYASKVDGFRLYTIRGGRKPISPQINANGNGSTFGYVGGASNSFNGQCFVVTAFVGSNESADSKPFCVSGGVSASGTTLAPDHLGSYELSQGGNTGVLGSILDGLLDPAGIFAGLLHPNSHGWVDGAAVVGYEHRTQKGTFGDSFYNMFGRAGAHFDTSAITGRYVSAATLTLAVDFAYTGPGNTPQKSQNSCTVTVEPATQLWWDETGNLGNVDPSSASTAGGGSTVTIDVTRTVRNWANGAANDGFVFIGGDENLKAFTESSCLSHYQTVSLTVNYF